MRTSLAACGWLGAAVACAAAGNAYGQGWTGFGGNGGFRPASGWIGNTPVPGRLTGLPRTNHVVSRREAQRFFAPPMPMRQPVAGDWNGGGHVGPSTWTGTPGDWSVPLDVGAGTLMSGDAIGRPLLPCADPYGSSVAVGSGVTVSGVYSDDNFRLRFHLGWPGIVVRHHDVCPPYVNFPWWGGWYSYYDWYGYNDYPYIDAPYGVVDPTLAGYTARPPVPTTPPMPEAEPTVRERGDLALASDQPDRAVAAYRVHLVSYPDDTEVMRLLGLALIDAGDPKEGVAVMGLAYHKDLSLCEKPISSGLFGSRGSDVRRNVNRVSAFAQSSGSASAWLTMAVLVQAEGRAAVAHKLLDKARAAGLDRAIADRLAGAIGR